MGKRSDFERRERDFYATPPEAVQPLFKHLPDEFTFDEPCAGQRDLVKALGEDRCEWASDIHKADGVNRFAVEERRNCFGDYFITNPPWPAPGKKGDPTISIALHLSEIAPTWLLLPADFCHNKYFRRVAKSCVKVVSVGRVSWMGNGVSSLDNCAWMLFDAKHDGPTTFHSR